MRANSQPLTAARAFKKTDLVNLNLSKNISPGILNTRTIGQFQLFLKLSSWSNLIKTNLVFN